MNQSLSIGFTNLDSGWLSISRTLGISAEKVDFHKDLLHSFSLIVINSSVNESDLQTLEVFVDQGGAVLELDQCRFFTEDKKIRNRYQSTIINESDHKAFDHIPLLDLFAKVSTHRDSILFNGILHFEFHGDGVVAYLGLDLPSLLSDTRYMRKRFYSSTGIYPDELVSTVSKHELMEVFEGILRELHFQRNLPYLKLWNSPTPHPVFCFRIDSDYGDREHLDQLNHTLQEYNIPASWFLHVRAHEHELSHFQRYENQEIALHGYEHGTTSSVAKAQLDIQKGLAMLLEEGYEVDGYCAPYGIWNKAYEKSIPVFEFDYTSEFTLLYDGTPLPVLKDQPLQIPVHPICTGSLNRKKYNETQVADYFLNVMKAKMNRYEPVIFYHHPMQPGLDSLTKVFAKINDQQFTKLTFKEYAAFWENRSSCTFQAVFDGDRVMVNSISDPDLLLQSYTEHDSFNLLNVHQTNEVNEISISSDFKLTNSYLPSAEEAEILRRRDLSLIKTSLLDWKNRNHL